MQVYNRKLDAKPQNHTKRVWNKDERQEDWKDFLSNQI